MTGMWVGVHNENNIRQKEVLLNIKHKIEIEYIWRENIYNNIIY